MNEWMNYLKRSNKNKNETEEIACKERKKNERKKKRKKNERKKLERALNANRI